MFKKIISQPKIKKPPLTPSKPKSPLERGGVEGGV
jgi:hypothetical protein